MRTHHTAILACLTLLACTKAPDDSGAGPGASTDAGSTDAGTTDAGSTDAGSTLSWTAASPDDDRLVYVGRWDHSDPAAPWVGWQGASVTLRMNGTAATVDLSVGDSTEYFRVIVDGDGMSSQKFAATSAEQTYSLAEDLDPGDHEIMLVKESFAGTSTTFLGVEVLGELLDPGPLPSHHIEFYGDSNLAGSSLESEHNDYAWDLVGSHFTYAGITARMFDADYHNISWGGSTIGTLHDRFDRTDWYADEPAWDFDSYVPDVVVLNIGANDVGTPVATIKDGYNSLLDDLRAVHPDAHIVVYNAWGWDSDEPANYTDQVVAARHDDNMSVATFPWVLEQWHGCETDHAGMATYLAAHLQSVMGWTASPPDVISGYGWLGDVANGSFEDVAPFGGYGWRYFDDPGVSRIVDDGGKTTEAHDGVAFLRLSDGASSHQPNPAVDGSVVTVTAWIRGGSAGDQLTATLDFRDQDMWSTPLQTQSWTEDLTTDWQQVTWTATAPVGAARPVFHTRLTLSATSGMADIDQIGMTTE